MSVSHGHQHRALGTRFVDVTALQIARKHDPRVARQNFLGMYMAEGPIIVTMPAKLSHRTGCVVVVQLPFTHGTVQQTDVEPIRIWRGIGERDIVGDSAGGEALTVNRDWQPRKT